MYDFARYERTADTETLLPRRAIIVEGILIYTDAGLRRLMDVKVFVDTDDDTRFIRRLQRDITERGRTVQSVIDQYLGTVKPMHLEFVEPSKRYADIIVPQGGHNAVAIDMLLTLVRGLTNQNPENLRTREPENPCLLSQSAASIRTSSCRAITATAPPDSISPRARTSWCSRDKWCSCRRAW